MLNNVDQSPTYWHFQEQKLAFSNADGIAETEINKKSVFDRNDKNKMNNSLQIDVGMKEVFASDSNINSIFSLRNFIDHNFLSSPTAFKTI